MMSTHIQTLWQRFSSSCLAVMDFQQRVWIVSIGEGLSCDTFVVDEDSFTEPLQWMKRKHYTNTMLVQVSNMKRSQAKVFNLEGIPHRLIRVR
ncbi:hypothetical protein [Photobacterium frigidiphilum]|uniref:hypothetical protein n=1 Tax=Photobacterium frigidiphilum TaxID=264736 RepID=UPI003FA719CA